MPAFRAFAEELVKQTTRQFQAVVTLDRQTQSQFTSLTDRLNNAQKKLNEEQSGASGTYPKSAPQRRSQSLAPVAAKEEDRPDRDRREPREARADREEREERQVGEEADFGSASESESVSAEKREAREEDRPPHRGEAGEAERSARGSERPPEPADPPRAPAAPRKRKRSRSRGRRGGSRHQATYRGLYEPGKEFHHRGGLEPRDLGGHGHRGYHRYHR